MDSDFRISSQEKQNVRLVFGERSFANKSETDKNLQLKARQVAWRQVFRWVQAQLAMVDTEMVTVDEVFFPYIQTRNGQTVYELHKNNLLQLGSGNNS